MRWNPVFRKEILIDSRSARLPVVIFIFNMILTIAALFNLFRLSSQAQVTAEIQYVQVLELYALISSLEMAMLLIIMPALTASAICGEKERQTFDLMLTTSMDPLSIISGKLTSSQTEMLVLLLSALPVQSLVFIFGGVTAAEILLVFITYGVAAMLTGSIGIFCSSVCRRSVASNVVSYIVTVVLTIGTFSMLRFAGVLGIYEPADGPGSLLYLLLLNPAVTYACVINRQIGAGGAAVRLAQLFGSIPQNAATRYWIPLSLMVQIAVSLVLIAGAVKLITPGGRRHRTPEKKAKAEKSGGDGDRDAAGADEEIKELS